MGKTIKEILLQSSKNNNFKDVNKIIDENPVYKDCFKKTLAVKITNKSLESEARKDA